METTKTIPIPWPVLSYEKYKDTVTTVHLWTQIIGKIRLKQLPWINHSWHVTLYVYPRGLTTGNMPYEGGSFQIELDFIDHVLNIVTCGSGTEKIPLQAQTVAAFYDQLFSTLERLGIHVTIYGKPNELPDVTPFQEDHRPRIYDKNQMNLLLQALVKSETVMTAFRACFRGKTSPVHFFWGAFDLAVTRFSGREAPEHHGGIPNIPDRVMREAYSHEVSSCGFWPGSELCPMPLFYAYCYPTPSAFGTQPVEPAQAFFSTEMGEFLLPYEAVQASKEPEEVLLQFLRTTYKAAADTGNWDRSLECDLSLYKK